MPKNKNPVPKIKETYFRFALAATALAVEKDVMMPTEEEEAHSADAGMMDVPAMEMGTANEAAGEAAGEAGAAASVAAIAAAAKAAAAKAAMERE